ncbi:hypothetical protein [Larkinella soli]|uniref:hypothetical protein n=1 Tax=Larkinella soli TaxID=1770527 RepID=UPI000FFB1CE5|nr:hypothetical protein [Larkinella soli]
MQVLINTVNIPFQVGEDVFVHRALTYWSNDTLQTVPYFSGKIKSIELCIDPQSRFIRKTGEQSTLLVDLIKYEIQPHSHFNPFGPVQILDKVQTSTSVFPTEHALLSATGQEPSVYLSLASPHPVTSL